MVQSKFIHSIRTYRIHIVYSFHLLSFSISICLSVRIQMNHICVLFVFNSRQNRLRRAQTIISFNPFGLIKCSGAAPLLLRHSVCGATNVGNAVAVFNENYKRKSLRQTFPIYYELWLRLALWMRCINLNIHVFDIVPITSADSKTESNTHKCLFLLQGRVVALLGCMQRQLCENTHRLW